MLIPEPRIPSHELRPDDSELVAAAQVILLEDIDDAPLVRAGVMGGQGRSAGSIRDTAMLTGYVLLVGLVYLAVMWAIREWAL